MYECLLRNGQYEFTSSWVEKECHYVFATVLVPYSSLNNILCNLDLVSPLIEKKDLGKEGARDAKTLAAWALYKGLNRSGILEKHKQEKKDKRHRLGLYKEPQEVAAKRAKGASDSRGVK